MAVERRLRAKSGLDVTVVGMGTWRTFDVRGSAAEANTRAVVDAALASGSAFVDSPPLYGAAREVLARAPGGRRATVLVATAGRVSLAAEGECQIEHAIRLYGGRVDLYAILEGFVYGGWPAPGVAGSRHSYQRSTYASMHRFRSASGPLPAAFRRAGGASRPERAHRPCYDSVCAAAEYREQ